MATSQLIPELDRKGLRSFGITTGVIVAVLFGLFFPWLLDHAIPRWPWILCGVLATWGVVAPSSLRPVYRVWMRFGLLMSKVTTPLILGIVFYVVITPIALVRALLQRDSMARKLDERAETYRVVSKKPERENLERPF